MFAIAIETLHHSVNLVLMFLVDIRSRDKLRETRKYLFCL